MPPELLADVAVNAVVAGADPIFTYRVPAALRAFVQPGQLVWAPLRRQRVQGIVVDMYAWGEQPHPLAAEGLRESSPLPPPSALLADPAVIRDLVDVADPEAVLTAAQLRLARWLSRYYRAPLYETLSLMLPTGVAQESEPTWRATVDGMNADLGALPPGERGVLYYLRQHGETGEKALRDSLRGSDADLRDAYRALQERGLARRGARLTRPRARPRIERFVRLAIGGDELDALLGSLERAPKQRNVISYLAELAELAERSAPEVAGEQHDAGAHIPASALYEATGSNLSVLRALADKGAIELAEREVRRDPLAGDTVPPDIPPQLTAGQERVWKPISAALDAAGSQGTQTFLLHGVTGSGKTELYLRAIGRTLRLGRQALVLVPEIALTTQLVRRFAARFPGMLAVLHSGLSAGERYDEWRRLRRGEARLAIGSRSAVFAPLPELGLIIVDEEHEPTYKHDGPPRYHARDTARQLAQVANSVLILGSATPSVETYHAARSGQVTLLELLERVGMGRDHAGLPRAQSLPLPPVRLVDMRRELQSGNRSIFSRPLQEGLNEALERGDQAILFLNRRGAASFVMCRDCGHVVSCPNCSSPLTLHYAEREPRRAAANGEHDEDSILVCHSCSHRELVPTLCPQCWSPRVKSFGVGTQRVVEEVHTLFPQARTLRWDRDTVTRKGDHGRMLDRFLAREADVLVGTQMIAKGLDLPFVSVVGVVAADTGLYLPDFRAGERVFQLMTQVAGRAGRRSAGARVVIQTYTPDHYALRAAQEHDYAEFYQQEIAYRRQTGYPPFGRLVRFVYAGGSEERSRQEAEDVAADLRAQANAAGLDDWNLIGPAPAFFQRVRNRYRWHIVLRAADPEPLLRRLRAPRGWIVDIDPVHLL